MKKKILVLYRRGEEIFHHNDYIAKGLQRKLGDQVQVKIITFDLEDVESKKQEIKKNIDESDVVVHDNSSLAIFGKEIGKKSLLIEVEFGEFGGDSIALMVAIAQAEKAKKIIFDMTIVDHGLPLSPYEMVMINNRHPANFMTLLKFNLVSGKETEVDTEESRQIMTRIKERVRKEMAEIGTEVVFVEWGVRFLPGFQGYFWQEKDKKLFDKVDVVFIDPHVWYRNVKDDNVEFSCRFYVVGGGAIRYIGGKIPQEVSEKLLRQNKISLLGGSLIANMGVWGEDPGSVTGAPPLYKLIKKIKEAL